MVLLHIVLASLAYLKNNPPLLGRKRMDGRSERNLGLGVLKRKEHSGCKLRDREI